MLDPTVAGLSVHVIRRGNNRGPIFTDDYDRELFLALLERMSMQHKAAVHAFVLMTNHFHLIVTPGAADRLSLMMRDLSREYVLRYNRRHGRMGTLWSGRYRAILIRDERYWLTCLRYVEQNPVRAQMVTNAEGYRWSSFRSHALGEDNAWLVEHAAFTALGPTEEERRKNYRALFAETLTDGELVRQRLCTPERRWDRGATAQHM